MLSIIWCSAGRVNLDVNKVAWDFTDKAHNGGWLLRLFGIALVADGIFALLLGSGVWEGKSASGDQPFVYLAVILVYGAVVKVLGPCTWIVALELLNWITGLIQSWLHVSPRPRQPDRQRHVSRLEAERWLAQEPDAARREPVERQIAERRRALKRWLSVVQAGWVGVILVIVDGYLPSSTLSQLTSWNAWAPWVLGLLSGLPCLIHLWVGPPGHDMIELPSLAAQLQSRLSKGALASARARNPGGMEV